MGGNRGRRFSFGRNFQAAPVTQMADGENTEFRLKGKETRTIRYLVAMDGKKGNLEFRLESKNGGKDSKKIELIKE